jgi:hypothetical protein
MELCSKEKELGEITVILDRLSKEVLGNHQEGLAKTVPRLESKINDLVGSVASHTKVISNFIEFQASHNGEIKGKKELEERERIAKELRTTQKRDKIQRRFLYVMAIIAATGLSLTAYFGYTNRKVPIQIQETKEEIKKSIDLQEGISKITRGGYVKYNDQGLSDSIKLK